MNTNVGSDPASPGSLQTHEHRHGKRESHACENVKRAKRAEASGRSSADTERAHDVADRVEGARDSDPFGATLARPDRDRHPDRIETSKTEGRRKRDEEAQRKAEHFALSEGVAEDGVPLEAGEVARDRRPGERREKKHEPECRREDGQRKATLARELPLEPPENRRTPESPSKNAKSITANA